MRKLLYTPVVLALSAVLGGFAAVHAVSPSAAMAQDASPVPTSPAPSLPSPSPLDAGGTRLIINRMQQRLTANVSGTPDRQYVATMAALSPAIVAVCKREMRVGSDQNLRVTAQKIVSVEQENEAYLQRYAQTLHVNQAPL